MSSRILVAMAEHLPTRCLIEYVLVFSRILLRAHFASRATPPSAKYNKGRASSPGFMVVISGSSAGQLLCYVPNVVQV